MKNALINKSVATLLILMFLADFAIADESFSISVSCSIPSVPGLNAPPLTQNAEEKSSSYRQDAEIETEQDESLIKEERKEQIVLAGGNVSMVTTTIYSR